MQVSGSSNVCGLEGNCHVIYNRNNIHSEALKRGTYHGLSATHNHNFRPNLALHLQVRQKFHSSHIVKSIALVSAIIIRLV